MSRSFRKRNFRHHFILRTKVRQRKFDKIMKIVKFLVAVVIIFGSITFIGKIIYGFIFSSRFEIKSIEVEGLQLISKEKFLDCLPVKLGDNLIETYFVNISNKLKGSIPEIKLVKTKRQLPDKIKFIVVEREPIAKIEINGKLNAIDEENVFFHTNRDIDHLPQIELHSEIARANAVKLLKSIREKDKKVYLSISKLYNIGSSTTSDFRFAFLLRNNTKILFGKYSPEVIDIKLKLLNKTLQDAEKRFESIEYIDLNLFDSGRIILKPIGKIKFPEV